MMPLKESIDLMRRCYACGSNNTVEYQYQRVRGIGIGELWYTNTPTDLVLCNRCYCDLIKNPRHDALCESGIGYSQDYILGLGRIDPNHPFARNVVLNHHKR